MLTGEARSCSVGRAGIAVISSRVMENRRVEREYLDEELRRLATQPAFRPVGWSDRDVYEFHRLVQCARAAYVAADLRNMRALRIKSGDSDDPGTARASLSSGRTIDLSFKNSESHCVVVFELSTSETDTAR